MYGEAAFETRCTFFRSPACLRRHQFISENAQSHSAFSGVAPIWNACNFIAFQLFSFCNFYSIQTEEQTENTASKKKMSKHECSSTSRMDSCENTKASLVSKGQVASKWVVSSDQTINREHECDRPGYLFDIDNRSAETRQRIERQTPSRNFVTS